MKFMQRKAEREKAAEIEQVALDEVRQLFITNERILTIL